LVLAVVWQSGQLDRVALQPHLTLRLEHQQQHADLLARHLGAEPGMADEGAGHDPQPVADLERLNVLLKISRTVALKAVMNLQVPDGLN
jgi:hypothetical protein